MVDNRSDNVWTVEAAAAAAEVVFEVVVELEGLSILQGEDAVHAPSVLQFLQIAPHSGQLIGEIPSEAIRDVEVRRSVFEGRTGAVVGLRGVGLKVFAVAGVVHGAGPDVIRDGSDAMPSGNPEARLQCVVIRLAGGVLLQQVKRTVGIIGNVVARNTVVVDAIATQIGGVDLRLTRLAQIKETPQAMTLRPDITDLQHGMIIELLLHVEVVVFHVGSFDVAVEGKDIALIGTGGR